MNAELQNFIDGLSALNNVQDPTCAGPFICQKLPIVLNNPHILDGLDLSVANDEQYGKFTLYTHTGKHPWSVQVLVWKPGAKTPVHNHKCFCTFAMLQGTIDEIQYDANATYQQTISYTTGDIACMIPDGDDVHCMSNTSDTVAISLHFYGINGHQDNSIKTIFTDTDTFRVA